MAAGMIMSLHAAMLTTMTKNMIIMIMPPGTLMPILITTAMQR